MALGQRDAAITFAEMFDHVLAQNAVDRIGIEQLRPVAGLSDIQNVPVRENPSLVIGLAAADDNIQRVKFMNPATQPGYFITATQPAIQRRGFRRVVWSVWLFHEEELVCLGLFRRY